MANIRKSFSFRNGVQVDEDNFIVNANGLVGIGTSIPSQNLDVRGTTKVVGLITASDLFIAGVSTISEVRVGSAITIGNSGIITATSFFGDGSTLSNLPTSQWIDVDVGLGFTSIHSVGNVGIATTDPRTSFQVGGTPGVAGKRGVGINSIGNIHATGVTTSASFVGPLTGDVQGNVTGIVTGSLVGNVTGNVVGNIDGDVNSTGLSTFTTLSVTGLVNVGTAATFNTAGLDVTGVTSSTSFVGPITGDVTGNVTGNVVGDLTGDVNSGIVTASTELNVGTGGTALTALNLGKVGIGTEIPSSDLTIKKESNTSVEVISEGGVPNVSIGLTGETKNKGILRFNNNLNTFDVINNDTGDLNFIIDGDSNSSSGNFKFLNSTSEKIRITGDGKLGIAVTNPSHQLHVVGTSTITGNAFIGGNLSIGGTFSGSLALGQTLEANIFTTTGVSTFSQVNVSGPIGFASESPAVDVDYQAATASFGAIGIGTTIPNGAFNVQDIAFIDTLGINTTGIATATAFDLGRLQVVDTKLSLFQASIRLDYDRFSTIGFGTFGAAEEPEGVLDLSRTGEKHPTPWFKLPEMSTTRRNSLTSDFANSGITTNSIIYNTTRKQIEIYLATPCSVAGNSAYWVGISTGTGGGSGLQSRTTASASTSPIANGAAANITITTAKTYALHKIQTSHAAWVTVYTDTTSRSNDASRAETTDPTPGSGVVAEVIVGAGTTQILSPGVIGYNNDTSPSTNTYLKVVNKSGTTQPITVTLHYLQLEN